MKKLLILWMLLITPALAQFPISTYLQMKQTAVPATLPASGKVNVVFPLAGGIYLQYSNGNLVRVDSGSGSSVSGFVDNGTYINLATTGDSLFLGTTTRPSYKFYFNGSTFATTLTTSGTISATGNISTSGNLTTSFNVVADGDVIAGDDLRASDSVLAKAAKFDSALSVSSGGTGSNSFTNGKLLGVSAGKIVSLAKDTNITLASTVIFSSGFRNAGVAVNYISGNTSWSNGSNITGDTTTASYATATLSASNATWGIKGTTYNFPLPENITITGIKMRISRKASTGSAIRDSAVRLVKAGAIVGSNKASGTYWGTTESVAEYGSETDLWGTTWTRDTLMQTGFGICVSAQNTSGSSATASLNWVSINVYYQNITSQVQTPFIIKATTNNLAADTGVFQIYNSLNQRRFLIDTNGNVTIDGNGTISKYIFSLDTVSSFTVGTIDPLNFHGAGIEFTPYLPSSPNPYASVYPWLNINTSNTNSKWTVQQGDGSMIFRVSSNLTSETTHLFKETGTQDTVGIMPENMGAKTIGVLDGNQNYSDVGKVNADSLTGNNLITGKILTSLNGVIKSTTYDTSSFVAAGTDSTKTVAYSWGNLSAVDSMITMRVPCNGLTLSKIYAIRTGGTSASINATRTRAGSTVDLLTANYSVSTSMASAGTVQNTTVQNGDIIRFSVRAISGTITELYIQADFTRSK